MNEWVLVDTLIWASFFSKPGSTEKRELDDLIDADRVALVGPIVAEVLLGFRRKVQADWIASRLRSGTGLRLRDPFNDGAFEFCDWIKDS